jgi:gamma-glutamyltranspeptidase / glutathione hydrolase
MKCGLAGDVIALFRQRGGALRALVSVGAGCLALSKGEKMEPLGPRSVGIPGAPDGYNQLANLGNLNLEKLTAPAIRAAEIGVPWTQTGLSYLRESADLLARYSPENPYSRDGRIPAVGERLQLPGLGQLLERFTRYRADLFCFSDGDRLVDRVTELGGILSKQDLLQRPARFADVKSTRMGSCTISATPEPTGGVRLMDVIRRSIDNPQLIDVVRDERARSKAKGSSPANDGTSVVTAADDQGNAVVIVHSNSFPRFGSGVVLNDGLVLNNRPGRGFDLAAPEGAANAPKAGRVPQTTLHAWALDVSGVRYMGATPGGVNQLPWNAQTIIGLMRGLSISEVITSPRWALDETDNLTAEPGAEVSGSNSGAIAVPSFSLRSAQQILRIDPVGPLQAVADPRVDTRAIAAY